MNATIYTVISDQGNTVHHCYGGTQLAHYVRMLCQQGKSYSIETN